MLGRAAVESLAGDAGNHLAPQSGYLHLEELVDAFGKEDEELDPLEQGQVYLGHQIEQAVVEVEVGQLTGEVRGLRTPVVPGPACMVGLVGHGPTLAVALSGPG